jgi:DNA-binding XRE family transcriptional regulator
MLARTTIGVGERGKGDKKIVVSDVICKRFYFQKNDIFAKNFNK